VVRADRAVAHDFDDPSLVVRALALTGRLARVVDLLDRGVLATRRQNADHALIAVLLLRKRVPATPANVKLHVEGGLFVADGGDVNLGVRDVDAGRANHVRACDSAGAGHFNAEDLVFQRHAFGGVDSNAEVLQVEEQFGDVFLNAGDGGELMRNLVYANGGRGRAFDLSLRFVRDNALRVFNIKP